MDQLRKKSLTGLTEDDHGALGLITLYNPPPPTRVIADIVFIHGLGGGSRKTWSYSPHPNHFWPLAWLPVDPDFSDIRIHSFGYKANWGERRQSVLNIHDFAQSLIGELKNNPSIRRKSTRIILVGHSMGGCVAKKAYILAHQDPACKELAEQVHSMFFLGTPHRGSSMAAILKNILMVTWSTKPFVTDLTPNSSTLTEINDAFRHVATGLRLWSFYETLPVKKILVVDRHSATLGYHNEEIAAMNTDHRHVCKFESPDDPNYKMLRNALHTAVDMIRPPLSKSVPLQPSADSVVAKQSDSVTGEVSSRLRSFLGVRDTLEDDLVTFQVLREPGSCQWFTEGMSFTSWKAGKAPGILWLTGKPAAGKSVLSSYVIDQLKPPYAYCSYFFYKHAKTGKSTLSDCFRSLAFQMATQDSIVREKLLQIEDEGIVWDEADEVSVWRRLFVNNIFKLSSISQHFWVIDGLDECVNFSALFMKKLLATLPDELRVFATSRNLDEIERGLASLGRRANLQTLSDSDTLEDMRLFLTTKLKELNRLESDEDREAMCEKILKKSSGSFLWTRLVLQEFENLWTEEAIEDVLNEVPASLQEMYFRMVQSIEVDKRKAKLAKCILAWVVLASRPLTVDELRCAVKLDANETLKNMDKAIPSLCGQLVFIDKGDKVHMIHETAREFLITETLSSELAVYKAESHTHLASVLLRYLSGDVLKPQQLKPPHGVRPRGFVRPSTVTPPDLSLLDYASIFFSEHVFLCASENDNLMDELCVFLKSNNILSWIEHIAQTNDLNAITRTAMNLRGYLSRRTKYVPSMDPSVCLVDCWVIDFIRVAAKFRSQLLSCPSSIHCLIPPLCPSDSIISRTFTKDARSSLLIVKGLPLGNWDDCLIRIDFQRGQTTAVSHGNRFFAVGLSTGQISLYDRGSLQCLRRMAHPERVKILEFSHDDKYLASCGAKYVLVSEPKSGTKIHSFPLQSPPIALVFLGVDELLCASQSSEVTKWSLETGEVDSISWKDSDHDTYPQDIPDQPPSRAAFLAITDDILLAVGYRNHPVLIWSVYDQRLLGMCESDVNNGIDDIAFNPNPDIVALVVSYNDGNLCVFDYVNMALEFTQPKVFAHSIACSSDGRSLVTGSSQGTIEVFEFDHSFSGNTTLTLIYRINAFDDSIRGVIFSPDGLRFVDVRGQQCRVWAPAALVRKDNELESTSDVVSLPPTTVGMLDEPEEPEITCPLEVSTDGGCVIAGKSNGDVVLFSTIDGQELGVLYRHARGASIVNVALGKQCNLVISADDSGRVLVAELTTPLNAATIIQRQRSSAARVILDRRFGAAVVRVLVNAPSNRLLVSGHDVDELWELPSGRMVGERLAIASMTALSLSSSPATALSSSDTSDSGVATSTFTSRSIFQHPVNPVWFVIMTSDIARIFCWADFVELTSSNGIQFERPAVAARRLQSPKLDTAPPPNVSWLSATASYHIGPGLVVELLRPSPSAPPYLHLWPAATFDPSSRLPTLPATEPNLDVVGSVVLVVLGFVGASTLVFLDVNLWVCSIELRSVSTATVPPRSRTWSRPATIVGQDQLTQIQRHFFALSEWRTTRGELLAAISTAPRGVSRNFVFANGHLVVVVKNGLNFSEGVAAVPATAMASGNGHSHGEGSSGQHVWKPVSGSMHRRASNW